ncbi:MAG: alpha/beta hydrolase, partial [Nitrospiraceae bacterium]|nr:alpha/beta hydrolase [Nitrospiraceae bacterium]
MKTKTFKALSVFPLTLTLFEAVGIGVILPSMSTLAAAPVSEGPASTKPTIVLVHGAFAESSSWNGVATRLIAHGYPVVAAANPLRGLRSDSDFVSTVFQSIHGPIIAVGHSYAGMLITDAAAGNAQVKALVYVAAFAPDPGESAAA